MPAGPLSPSLLVFGVGVMEGQLVWTSESPWELSVITKSPWASSG